ncbi:MAG: hypothetical protein R2865_15050 [Deinococcales bacterium]
MARGVYIDKVPSERWARLLYGPRAFQGAPTSVQSDIYSLVILAYELLLGERPLLWVRRMKE